MPLANPQEMLDTYTHKKIKFQDVLDKNYVPDLTLDMVNTINKMSAMTNEENFKIKKINGGVYVCFGDEAQTIDNAKIKIMDDGSLIDFDESSVVFNTSQFVMAYKTLEKQDIRIKFLKESIIMTGENEVSKKLISLRGRKV